jgi:epoxyqueuosine reductase
MPRACSTRGVHSARTVLRPLPAAPSDPAVLTARVRSRALELGFDAVGFARADVPLDEDHARYLAFVDAGMHGEMEWLAANADARRRVNGDSILAGARSVVCVARRYQRTPSDESQDPPFAHLIARYARGRDYHTFLRKKLRRLADFLRNLGTDEAPVGARPILDDAPVLERAWAARSGLGFIGKNGLLIVPGQGSLVLLGEVVTTLSLPESLPFSERCGACTRCLDACPTDAFAAPWVLDPRKCVSYLTIEHRSSIDEALHAGVGEHVFGCDDCQTVCPFNASTRDGARMNEASAPFRPHERWASCDLVALLEMNEDEFRALTKGSPLYRATRGGLARNAAIVLGNRRESDAIPALERAAASHDAAVVRDAATAALRRIGTAPAAP